MNLQALKALIRRRVRYRITGAGMLFTFAVALTGAGAFLSANNLLFLIFSSMLALLLVSGFISRLVLSGLEVELLLPRHVAARSESPARIRIRNLKRLTPSFSIELTGMPLRDESLPPIFTGRLYLPMIPGAGSIETAIDVNFPRRGRSRENLFALSTRFPFGFLRRTAVVSLRRETIVYPAMEPAPSDWSLLDAVIGEIGEDRGGTGMDFYRLRPYESTDSARLVHWKSSAKVGGLQVREFARERRSGVEVYLDRRLDSGESRSGPMERFERSIERCAFLIWNLSENDIELRFRSQGFTIASPAEGDIHAVLRYLALAEPLLFGSNAETESPLGDSGPMIAFTAYPEEYAHAGWTAAPPV